jgi:hypothetical protein
MNSKTKSTDPEVRNFQYALRLAGINTTDDTAHHVYLIQKKLAEKGDEFNLRDAATIQSDINKMYPEDEKVVGEKPKVEETEEVGEPA